MSTLSLRDHRKTLPFAQSRRQAQILILEILRVFLWLEFSPSLTLNKIEHFSKVSLHKKHDKRVEKAFATLGSIDFGNIWCYMQTI